jgi:hypothetical protein
MDHRRTQVLRRHAVPLFLDFDYRANLLASAIGENWSEEVKESHRQSRAQVIEGIGQQFGITELERKVDDFTAIGPLPSSAIAHHNLLLRQVRDAFVAGYYYPALTSGCALGERILNHLLLDMRESFRSTPEFKRVHRKDSFDDWSLAITTLEAWQVLQPDSAEALRELAQIRHRSLHFTPETALNTREHALAAIQHLMKVIEHQFSAFGTCPWFIEGTKGVCFIKKDWEADPFVRKYYVLRCPKVGPLFTWTHTPDGWAARDYEFYEDDREVTDEEFKELFNNRDPAKCAGIETGVRAGGCGGGVRLRRVGSVRNISTGIWPHPESRVKRNWISN